MSSIITTHSGSNTPIMTYSARPTRIAPSIGRMRNKSKANRSVVRSSGGVSGTFAREITTAASRMSAAMIRNGAASPNAPTVSAEIIGPSAKPPTSIDTPRPRLRPTLSRSLTMMMRRVAGIEMPVPMPIRVRPRMNTGRVDPNAMTSAPTTFNAKPKVSIRRACPLSASGASVSWAMNDVKKPTATMKPSPVSWMPYVSRQSSSIVNITP